MKFIFTFSLMATFQICFVTLSETLASANTLIASEDIKIAADNDSVTILDISNKNLFETCRLVVSSEPFARKISKGAKFSYPSGFSNSFVWSDSTPTSDDALNLLFSMYGVGIPELRGKSVDEIKAFTEAQYGRGLEVPKFKASFSIQSTETSNSAQIICLSSTARSYREFFNDLIDSSSIKPQQEL